jgi:protocatechuate 3,4-dioxygenase beta subunit
VKRRTFIKSSTAAALSIGVFGQIHWNGFRFEGNNPTTNDILGPFYRPGAPFKKNINPKGFQGIPLHLSGTIYREDGKTPFENCFIEIWQCNPKGEYDNISDGYVYRGAAKTGSDGKYYFITTKPVPYKADPNNITYRPAHIHLRISGNNGSQDLITQIYFKNDPYLPEDPSSSQPKAIRRILEIKRNKNNEDTISFDIVMSEKFPIDDDTFEKVLGIYDVGNGNTMTFLRKGSLLFWELNGFIREAFSYKGNNSFEGGNEKNKADFEFLPGGGVKSKVVQLRYGNKKVYKYEGIKISKYNDSL